MAASIVRLAIRNLPPSATIESVEQLLEQSGFIVCRSSGKLPIDSVKVQRIFKGKIGTSTKHEVASTAFVLVSNDLVGLRLCKKLAISLKDSPPLKCELALVQKVPKDLSKAAAEMSTAASASAATTGTGTGSWQSDPEYLNFQQPKPSQATTTAVSAASTDRMETIAAAVAVKEVAPLVAHMRKEMLIRRNKAQKAKKDSRKRKPALGAITTSGKAAQKKASSSSTQVGNKGGRQQNSGS